MNITKNPIYKVFFTILSILIISFIFINSSLDATESSVQSTGVMEFINSMIKHFGVNFEFSENFVRKSAHFIEYFVLAVSLYFMYFSYLKKQKSIIFITLSTGLLTASVDEIIQLFSNGRSCQLSDVMLDFSAVLIATYLLYFVLCILERRGSFKNE